MAFSPDGSNVAAGGFDKVLIVLDARNGQRVWTSPTLDQPINGVQFSPDGRSLALALGDYSKGTPGQPGRPAGRGSGLELARPEADRQDARLEAGVQVGRVQLHRPVPGRHQRRRDGPTLSLRAGLVRGNGRPGRRTMDGRRGVPSRQ